MQNNTSCIIADQQKEIFDNLCKDKWDAKLQSKFGQYADVVCNTKSTEDGGEAYLTLGIYNIQEELVNFSEELSSKLNLNKEETKLLIEKYIEIFNLTVDIEWKEAENKAEASLSLDNPYTDEFTDTEDLKVIKNEEKMLITEKLADCIEDFINTFMHDVDLDFDYKWSNIGYL